MAEWLARELVRYVVGPALGGRRPYDSPDARAMLAAIALHESGGWARFQRGPGLAPLRGLARGLWQFELAGVVGVARHRAARRVLDELEPGLADRLDAHPVGAWERLAWDDVTACRLARALLWTVPQPLPVPEPAAADEAARQYRLAWRPGRWKPRRWQDSWEAACRAVNRVPEGVS